MKDQDDNFKLEMREDSPTIDSAQLRVARWVISTLGRAVYSNHQERALRVVEEATEFAQSVKVPKDVLHRLIDRVYDRPVGDPHQELSGLAVTTLAAAASLNVSLADVLETEMKRIEDPEVRKKVQRHHNEKQAAGVAVEAANGREDGRDPHLISALQFGYLDSLDYDEAYTISRTQGHPQRQEVLAARARAKNETFGERMGFRGLNPKEAKPDGM